MTTLESLVAEYRAAKSLHAEELAKYLAALDKAIVSGADDFSYWPKELKFQEARKLVESLARNIADEVSK